MSQKTKNDVESAPSIVREQYCIIKRDKTIYGVGIFLVILIITVSVAVILTSNSNAVILTSNSNPCQNGGKYLDNGNNEYACNCDSLTDFYGDKCQYNISTTYSTSLITDTKKYKPCIPKSKGDSIPSTV